MISAKNLTHNIILASLCLIVSSACSTKEVSLRKRPKAQSTYSGDAQENKVNTPSDFGELVGSCDITTEFNGAQTEICIEFYGSGEMMPELTCKNAQGKFNSEVCSVKDGTKGCKTEEGGVVSISYLLNSATICDENEGQIEINKGDY